MQAKHGDSKEDNSKDPIRIGEFFDHFFHGKYLLKGRRTYKNGLKKIQGISYKYLK